jgi:alginate O-acetyltransferase complex protein AlgI
MLFNSYIFLFVFLPVTWLGWFILTRYSRQRFIIGFLALASLVFYGFWNPGFLPILIVSVVVNFLLGGRIKRHTGLMQKIYFAAAVAFNLLLLGYYKYSYFLLTQFSPIVDFSQALLPLGISFYTFQQLAYVVDIYKGRADEPDFITYLLFVTFFPHCIAGPLVHHREMMPQFTKHVAGLPEHVSVGVTLLIIGLFKKVVIADSIGPEATTIFSLAAQGSSPGLLAAWGGALCYSFQIYFDFSAYSDMASGIARMFGVTLPANFASPYKAVSFIDFWKRWHISLSRFLRDYIYIPLGGGRRGRPRQLANLLVTMLIGGFWHGASWLMIGWGALHGVLLAANHIWRWYQLASLPVPLSRIFVFIIITFAWVPFRAENPEALWHMYRGMVGMNGIDPLWTELRSDVVLIAAFALPCVVWWLPNSYEWLRQYRPVLPTEGYPASVIRSDAQHFSWHPAPLHALVMATLFFIVLLKLTDASEFLYFQF